MRHKMKPKQSVYSKMYLVTPNVYDKVLQSLDDKAKKTTVDLNLEKEMEERPSEKLIENIAAQELEMQPEELPVDNPNPEFIDPEPQQEPEQTFGEVESTSEPGEIVTEAMAQDIPSEALGGPGYQQEMEPEIVNPLRTNCAQPEVQDQFIPLIKQGVKRSRVLKTASKIIKPKLYVPSIVRKLNPTPQIQRLQQAEKTFQPNIQQIRQLASKLPQNQGISRSKQFTQPEQPVVTDSKGKQRRFSCNFCLKAFLSAYHLRRHISTVHKNLVALSDPNRPENLTYSTIPDEDIQMDQPVATQTPSVATPRVKKTFEKQFESWAAEDKPRTSVKRTPAQAKLKYTPRPQKYIPAEDYYTEWDKMVKKTKN